MIKLVGERKKMTEKEAENRQFGRKKNRQLGRLRGRAEYWLLGEVWEGKGEKKGDCASGLCSL